MPPETVSTFSQTDAIDDVDISGVVDDYKNDLDFEKIDISQLHAEINDNITVESENSKSPQQLEDQFNDSECSNEEFLATSGDESETDDECPDDEVSAIDEEIYGCIITRLIKIPIESFVQMSNLHHELNLYCCSLCKITQNLFDILFLFTYF